MRALEASATTANCNGLCLRARLTISYIYPSLIDVAYESRSLALQLRLRVRAQARPSRWSPELENVQQLIRVLK